MQRTRRKAARRAWGWMLAASLPATALAQSTETAAPKSAAAAAEPAAESASPLKLPELRDLAIGVPRPVQAATAMLGLGRQRLALVLGLSTVGARTVLDSAPRDVQAVATVLREAGFVVMAREDLLAADLRATLAEFQQRLQPGGLGFVYVTGLGAQLEGRNVLLPRDALLDPALPAGERQAQWRDKAVPLSEVVDALMGPAGSPRLLVVDAAYQHPALADLPTKGLAEQRLPPGVIALFAQRLGTLQEVPAVAALPQPAPTDAQQIAASRFARTLVGQLAAPRAKAPDALRATRRALVDSSLGQIEPWLSGDTESEEVAEASLVDGLIPRTPEDLAREAARQVARTMSKPATTAVASAAGGTAPAAAAGAAPATIPATVGGPAATAVAGNAGEQSVAEVLEQAEKSKPTSVRPPAASNATAAAQPATPSAPTAPVAPTSAGSLLGNVGSAAGTAISAVGTAASVAGTVGTVAAVAAAVSASQGAAAVSTAGSAVAGVGSLAGQAVAMVARGGSTAEPAAAIAPAVAPTVAPTVASTAARVAPVATAAATAPAAPAAPLAAATAAATPTATLATTSTTTSAVTKTAASTALAAEGAPAAAPAAASISPTAAQAAALLAPTAAPVAAPVAAAAAPATAIAPAGATPAATAAAAARVASAVANAPTAVARAATAAPDPRTVRAQGGGERPAFTPRVNPNGYAEGDTYTYETRDIWKDQFKSRSTTAIEEVLPDGRLVANGQQLQLDAQGRVLRETHADGSVTVFEPRQDLWWSAPKRGESRDLRFTERLVRPEDPRAAARSEIEWKGSASVGRARQVETPAGTFEALPIESSGWQYAMQPDGTRLDSKWSRTVWYSPQLGHPVAIDIEDTDRLGRLLRRERVELLHAQTARTAP